MLCAAGGEDGPPRRCPLTSRTRGAARHRVQKQVQHETEDMAGLIDDLIRDLGALASASSPAMEKMENWDSLKRLRAHAC